MSNRIVLFGGSFDPIHNGHIYIAEKIKKYLDASQVIFILAKNPRWKSDLTSHEHRLAMLKLAIEGKEGFSCSTYEIERPDEINYTIDTIEHFKKKYKEEELFFLIGYDQLDKLHNWKDIKRLSTLAKIVAYGRGEGLKHPENIDKYGVLCVEEKLYNISSTDIRMMRKGDMPSKVIKYILDNNLYYLKKLQNKLSPTRFAHCKSVSWLSYKVALNTHLDPFKALIAGLLHDLGKELEKEEEKNIMNSYFSQYITLPRFAYHQFVGCYLAKKEFNIEDEEVLDAIKYHATGNANMSLLGKIIYACDKIEPLRNFDSSALISACLKNAEEGFIEVLAANKEFLLAHNKNIDNDLSMACFNFYLK